MSQITCGELHASVTGAKLPIDGLAIGGTTSVSVKAPSNLVEDLVPVMDEALLGLQVAEAAAQEAAMNASALQMAAQSA